MPAVSVELNESEVRQIIRDWAINKYGLHRDIKQEITITPQGDGYKLTVQERSTRRERNMFEEPEEELLITRGRAAGLFETPQESEK